jgi:hypothetical protein
MNTSINKKYQYKILYLKIKALQNTFQVDRFQWSETIIPILFFVDIMSRKAWAYVLTKSKKRKGLKYRSISVMALLS